jgi:hypothetical protein
MQSEEQWQIVGYCKHCGAAFWAMGGVTKWKTIYCDGEWNGHELDEDPEEPLEFENWDY